MKNLEINLNRIEDKDIKISNIKEKFLYVLCYNIKLNNSMVY